MLVHYSNLPSRHGRGLESWGKQKLTHQTLSNVNFDLQPPESQPRCNTAVTELGSKPNPTHMPYASSPYERVHFLFASLLLVVRPGAPTCSSFLLLVVRPGAPSSVLAPSSLLPPGRVGDSAAARDRHPRHASGPASAPADAAAPARRGAGQHLTQGLEQV